MRRVDPATLLHPDPPPPDPGDCKAYFQWASAQARLYGARARDLGGERERCRYRQARFVHVVLRGELWRDGGYESAEQWLKKDQRIGTSRQARRHLKVTVLLACQDPLSVPAEVLALLDGAGVFQHGDEKWNRCLAQHIAGLRGLSAKQTAELPSGVMWFWAKSWCLLDERLEIGGPLLVEVRPRVSHHGGATRTAVERT